MKSSVLKPSLIARCKHPVRWSRIKRGWIKPQTSCQFCSQMPVLGTRPERVCFGHQIWASNQPGNALGRKIPTQCSSIRHGCLFVFGWTSLWFSKIMGSTIVMSSSRPHLPKISKGFVRARQQLHSALTTPEILRSSAKKIDHFCSASKINRTSVYLPRVILQVTQSKQNNHLSPPVNPCVPSTVSNLEVFKSSPATHFSETHLPTVYLNGALQSDTSGHLRLSDK